MTTGKRISEFNQLLDIADQDILLAVDVSDTTSSADGTTKKVGFSEIRSEITSQLNISNWDTAYSWGPHASAGYLTSYTETDPIFTASAAANITTTQIGQWDTAYGWGNHALQGYLQSISAQSINALDDVDTTGANTNDVLQWNGTSWVAGAGGGGGSISSLGDIADVNFASLTAGQVVTWTGAEWANVTPAADITTSSIGDLSDVDLSGVADGSLLAYNNSAGEWQISAPINSFFTRATTGGVGTPYDIRPVDSGDNFSVGGTLADPAATLSTEGKLTLKNATFPPKIIFNADGDDIGEVEFDGIKWEFNNEAQILTDGTVKPTGLNIKTNNVDTSISGEARDIKVIGNAPFYHDGTQWREFYLIGGAIQTNTPDTDWDDVMIRMTGDTDFTESKFGATPDLRRNYSSAPEVDIVTAPRKVGDGSIRINNDSRLEFPFRSGDYDFTGSWTMEAWFFINDITANNQSLFSGQSDSVSDKNWALLVDLNGPNAEFSWYNQNASAHDSQSGTQIYTAATSSVEATWIHVALQRDPSDGKIRLFIDGSPSGVPITDNEILNPTHFTVGSSFGFNNVYNFDGFVDDIRVSKGARYDNAGFVAPTTQLPISGSTTQDIAPPGDKKGIIFLGTSPTWKGTSGVTVTRPQSGKFRLTFDTSFGSADDYFVMTQGMEQTHGVYTTVEKTTGYVDINVYRTDTDAAVNAQQLAVQIHRA